MKRLVSSLYGLAVAAVVIQTFAAPDAEKFLNPRLARIIFYHLPCALLTTLFLGIGVYYSFRYLSTRRWEFEIKSSAANEIGFILAVLTMATGILFSKVQWGTWWQWDPRQTSFLLVLLIFGAYTALRMGIDNPEKRAIASAGYSAAAALPSFFLIFVFPRLPAIQNSSFHPSQTVVSGGFDRIYSITILEVLFALSVLTLWIYRLRIRTAYLEFRWEISDARMDDSGVAAATGVVRTVCVPAESGLETEEIRETVA